MSIILHLNPFDYKKQISNEISTKLMSVWHLYKINEYMISPQNKWACQFSKILMSLWHFYKTKEYVYKISIKLMSIWYLYNIKVHVAYLQRFRICDISTIWENTSMLQGLKLRNEKLCEIFDTLVANRLYNEPFQVF